MKARTRKLGCLILVGLAFVSVLLYAAALTVDAPLPAESDLIVPERPPLPDDRNGYLRLAEAYASFKEPDLPELADQLDDWVDELDWAREEGLSIEELREYLGHQEESWSPEKIESRSRELVAAAEETFERVQAALRAPGFRRPDLAGDGEHDPAHDIVRFAHQLLRVRAWMRHRDGRDRESFEDLLRLLDLAHLASREPRSLVDAITGHVFHQRAHEDLARFVAARELSAEVLSDLAREWARRAPPRDGVAFVLREEYWRTREVVLAEDFSEYTAIPWDSWAQWTYKPHLTLTWIGEHVRRCIAHSNNPLPSAPFAARAPEWSRWQSTWRGNQAGEVAADLIAAALSKILFDALDDRDEHTLTTLALALIAHEKGRGQLPRALEDLVPAYLDALPVGSVMKEPPQYSPETRTLELPQADGHGTRSRSF